jgi:hypothetical protein
VNVAILCYVGRESATGDVGVAYTDISTAIHVYDGAGNCVRRIHPSAAGEEANLIGKVTSVGHSEVVNYQGLARYDCWVTAGIRGNCQT